MIKIFNTQKGRKESLRVKKKGTLSLYVCGITPYDEPHLGHARVYTTFDLFWRLLTFFEYKVFYCRNVTDIDDKIILRAQEKYGIKQSYACIAQTFYAQFIAQMDALCCLRPTYEPRVTDHIPEIIAAVQSLIAQGYAYQANGSVYFRVNRIEDYGALSHQNIEKLSIGARVDKNSAKENPLDFVLWKADQSFWSSPWGKGRPGWHIECSVLAEKYLGKTIDVHAGGADLLFPHHENERAQSHALHQQQFALQWMHNGLVRVNKEKMSKSLGNFFTLTDLFKKFEPEVIRFYLMNHHYRSPLDFSLEDVAAFEKSYHKLSLILDDVVCQKDFSIKDISDDYVVVHDLLSYLSDDLNAPRFIGYVHQLIKNKRSSADRTLRFYIKNLFYHLLGIPLNVSLKKTNHSTDEIERLVAERERAREEKNWVRADAIRKRLIKLGVVVKDKKTE